MQRKILIVDDAELNRRILRKILCQEYAVLEAANGREALAILEQEGESISAMLLDLAMPEMDGYALLAHVQQDEVLSKIPAIVATGSADDASEERALSLGAIEFILKPYVPALILRRIGNMINLRETAAAVNSIRRDELTGLYNRKAFFEEAEKMIAAQAPGYYVLSCMDIDNFKVINDQYGSAKGDEVLYSIARTYADGFGAAGGICSRIAADNYAALYPYSFMVSGAAAQVYQQATQLDGMMQPVTISIGYYIVDDKTLSVSAMHDRATLAQSTVKRRYDLHVAQYDESMRARLLREQKIVTEMKGALESGQFEVWFQPQYNHATGALIGAEALVRWRHPVDGLLVAPGEFVPVFERNGFIYEMDQYVWQQTCILLRKWLDTGRQVLPVSVNVSRYDVLQTDFFDTITGLVERYAIPITLLRLEVTESAFAGAAAQITTVVKRLIRYGFVVEIDDFGSGYSSLNTLKDVPAAILKLDMRFLANTGDIVRGGNILESVVRMAKWIGMSVIAEGVETIAQADYLKSIGCNHMQGYLYSKPIPAHEYEALAASGNSEWEWVALDEVALLDSNAFWDPNSLETIVFNTFVGGAYIFEYIGGQVEILRANDNYAKVLGGDAMTVEEALKIKWTDCMDEASLARSHDCIRRAIETGGEIEDEMILTGLPTKNGRAFVRSKMKMIAQSGPRYLFYSTLENTTAQKEAEERVKVTAERLQAVVESIQSGITAVVVGTDDQVGYIFVTDRYFEMLGYTREQFDREVKDAFSRIHPQDLDRVMQTVHEVNRTGKAAQIEFRAIRRDGEEIWLHDSLTLTHFVGIDAPVQLSVFTDITPEKRIADNLVALNARIERDGRTLKTLVDDIPGGFGRMRIRSDESSYLVYANEGFCKLVGMTMEETVAVFGKDFSDGLHPEDHAVLQRAIAEREQNGGMLHVKLRLRHGPDGYIPLMVQGRHVHDAEGEPFFNVYFTDLTEQINKETYFQEMLPVALSAMLEFSSDFAFIKDTSFRYVCCSRAFAADAGLPDETKIVGMQDYDLYDKARADRYRADDQRLFESGEPVVDRVESISYTDGTQRHISTSKYPLRDAYGNLLGLYGVARDVTARREAEERLRISEEEIRLAIAQSGKMICLYDVQARTLTMPEQYAGKHALPAIVSGIPERAAECDILDEASLKPYLAFFDAILQGSKQGETEIPVRCADGSWCRERLSFISIFDSNDMPVKAVIAVEDVTEQHRVSVENRTLRENARVLRAAAEHSNRVTYRYDCSTRTMCADAAEAARCGLPAMDVDMPESAIARGTVLPESAEDFRRLFQRIHADEPGGGVKLHVRLANDAVRWIDMQFSLIGDGDMDGTPKSAVISCADITENHEKELAYQRYMQTLRGNAERERIIYFDTDLTADVVENVGGSIPHVFFPKAGCRHEDAVRHGVECLLPDEARDTAWAFFDRDRLLAAFCGGTRNLEETWATDRIAGHIQWFRSEILMTQDPYSEHIRAYTSITDITAAKLAAAEIQRKAEMDGMTGVSNREQTEAMIKRILDRADGTPCSLLIADLDNLKAINDTKGHPQGDAAIRMLAGILRAQFRHTDIVGRIGGDEFIAFIDGVGDHAKLNAMMTDLFQKMSVVRIGAADETRLSASIGIAVGKTGGSSFETLYAQADQALYEAKRAGKCRYAIFTLQ